MAKENLENLANYQWAQLAAQKLENRQLDIALPAMQKHYSQYGLENDPILAGAFNDAYTGIQTGNLTSRGLLEAISVYSSKYEKARDETIVSDLIKESGYKLSDEARAGLSKYENWKYKDLISAAKDKKNKDDKELKKAASTVQILENYKFEARLTPEMITENVDNQMEAFYPKKEEKDKKD
ncbi:MAG: hypothetical protein WC438_04165 [Candidatus Pacearchaeota archaeon]